MLYREIIAVCSESTKNTESGNCGVYTPQYDAVIFTCQLSDVIMVCYNVASYGLLEDYNGIEETQCLYPQNKAGSSVLLMTVATLHLT